MIIDESLRSELLVNFQPLNVVAAARAFPPPMALSAGLRGLLPRDKATQTELTRSTASYFATAAVDIWLRGVHSFLVSASLTVASPIWAVVPGTTPVTIRSGALLIFWDIFNYFETNASRG